MTIEFRSLADSGVREVIGYKHEGRPYLTHHDRQVMDQRAIYVFSFLQSWGVAAALGDLMFDLHSDEDQAKAQKPARIPATELVMRACEIVDAAWCELQHRGWIMNLPPYEDCA